MRRTEGERTGEAGHGESSELDVGGLARRLKAAAEAAKVGLFEPEPARLNLLGDRDIEISWISARLPCGPGEALDFGNGGGPLGLVAAMRGFRATAVDLTDVRWPYRHPALKFVRGDILKLALPPSSYDVIINCSTVEHVGIAGRYGVPEDRLDGDLEAMGILRDLMKSDGRMLLTVPCGRDAVFAPLCRVYGESRLPKLLQGFGVDEEQFWVKDDHNRWVAQPRQAALQFEAAAGSWNALRNVYALGCFVLRKSN